MRLMTMRGVYSLALTFMAASAVFAQDSLYLAQSGTLGSDLTAPSSSTFDIAGISRLVEVNGSEDSLLRSRDKQASAEESTADVAPTPIAPIAEITASSRGTGVYVLAGCGAAFAMGLGLCCMSMFSRKQRTIHTFTAGFVKVK